MVNNYNVNQSSKFSIFFKVATTIYTMAFAWGQKNSLAPSMFFVLPLPILTHLLETYVYF
jgi:hypothetical protein